jgi:hypothetical protein
MTMKTRRVLWDLPVMNESKREGALGTKTLSAGEISSLNFVPIEVAERT